MQKKGSIKQSRRLKSSVIYRGKLISKLQITCTEVNTFNSQWFQQYLPDTEWWLSLPKSSKKKKISNHFSRVNTSYPHKLTSTTKSQYQNKISTIPSNILKITPKLPRNHPIWSNSNQISFPKIFPISTAEKEQKFLRKNANKHQNYPKCTHKTNNPSDPTKLTTHTVPHTYTNA